MPLTPTSQFGIATAPQQLDCDDVLRVWQEADTIPAITHAWLFDHLMPIAGDPSGPIFEGWTLLSALAAQTQRLRLTTMSHLVGGGAFMTSRSMCTTNELRKMGIFPVIPESGLRATLGILARNLE